MPDLTPEVAQRSWKRIIFRSLLLVVGLTATVLFVFCLIMPIQDY